jgi:hypothetical protein
MIVNILTLNPPLCPSIQAACYCNALFTNSFLTALPITFASGCQSIIDTQCFLVNTDYNCPPINILHHVLSSNSSQVLGEVCGQGAYEGGNGE